MEARLLYSSTMDAGATSPIDQEYSTHMHPDEGGISLELLPVVEQAAIESAKLMGWGDRDAADQAAVDAMHAALERADVEGTVVIGEGERDEAPMLYIGEKVGCDGARRKVDIAVDPLEGTNLCALGRSNAIAVMAVSEPGGLLHAPDIYMEKLVVPPAAVGKVDIEDPVEKTVATVAQALDREVRDLVVVVLDRPRHEELIARLRKLGTRIRLIGDGDLSAAISVAVRGTNIHLAMGIGGAPEGVISAAGLKCLGGEIQARLRPKNDEQRTRCEAMGVDYTRKYSTADLAPGKSIVFLATGVTRGDLLDGVRFFGNGVRVSSMILTYSSRTIRFSDSIYLNERHNVEIRRL
jgi:fructose-1,6-bisphosphatase II